MKGASASSRMRKLDRCDAAKDSWKFYLEDEAISRMTAAVLRFDG